jgi:hypothetical protein
MTNKQLVILAVRQMPDSATMDQIEERIARLAAACCGRDGTLPGDDQDQAEVNRLVAELLFPAADATLN